MARRRLPENQIVEISALNPQGLGVGYVGEREVHLRNALPGEHASARILKRSRRILLGESHSHENSSPLRQQPACEYFPRCGGCTFQHMLYAEQLRFKQSGLLALLEKQGVEPARVEAPVHGPITGYRHKARLGVRCIGDEVLVGFRESFSSRVRRMDECLNLAPRLSALMVPLKAAISRLSIRERVPQIEVASGDEGVAVVVRHLEPLVGSDADVLIDMAETTDVRLYSQPGGYDSVRRLYPQSGSDLLSYSLEAFGLNLLFHPMEFTQVNPYVNRLLVQAALVNAGGLSGKRLIDLFCGIGNFSLAFARYGAQVRGYEGDISLTRRAKENAHRNGVSAQCEFYAKDLYDRDASEVGDADILVLDPPRSGAGDNLRTWAAGDVETVVYVSCKPETFATDARILHERGYRLERVGIYDMFPQTSHVETLGVFRRQ